jgi:hypothetical protein
MTRFIVRFRGNAPKREIIERLSASPSVTIVEETPQMVLLEAAEADIQDIVGSSSDVIIVPERHYEHPNPPLTTRKN